jgi:hypothetical membrane protein
MALPEPDDARRGRVGRTDRALAAGLVAGPVTFVAAWVVGGARTPGYSYVHDAISRTAAAGAPQRHVMTAGFVAYAVGVGAGSLALRRALSGPAWAAAAVSALGTAGVALTPLDTSTAVDRAHAVTATVGYIGLAATPLLAAPWLHAARRHRAAAASTAAGAVIAAALAASALVDDHVGLAQRIGLTTGDLWLAAAGIALASRRSDRGPTPRAGTGRRADWRTGRRAAVNADREA